jgi:hypothetical protein
MIPMKIMVLFTAFESIIGPEAIGRLRAQAGNAIGRIEKSGKLEAGGMFADRRGGYMLLNVSEGEELNELFGGDILDNFSIETHPVFTFEWLKNFFEKDKVQ